MKEVVFLDGRVVKVDADVLMCPSGEVALYKRVDGVNHHVASYPPHLIKDVRDYHDHPLKILAVKLLQATSKTEAHGSHKLCELAGVKYTDAVLPLLKKLREAGKVKFDAGKWTRV